MPPEMPLEPAGEKLPPRGRSIIVALGWILLILLGLALALLGYALGTQHGLHTLIGLAQRAAPGKLEVNASGHILGELDLRDLRYRDLTLELTIKHLQLRWQPGQLLTRRLQVDRLAIHGVEAHLPPPSDPPTAPKRPFSLPDIRLPLAVDLRDVEIQDVRIHRHGIEQPLKLDRARLVAASEGATLHLGELSLETPEANARLSGRLTPLGDYPLDLALDWAYAHPRLGEQQGRGSLKGDLRKLMVDHQIDGLAAVRVDAELTDLLTQPGWDARLKAEARQLGALSPALAGSPIAAAMRSKGTPDRFEASGQVTTTHQQTGPLRIDLALHGNQRTIHVRDILLALVDRPGRLALRGDLDLAERRIDITGDWQALSWPLIGKAQYETPTGTFRASGTPSDYRATLEARLAGEPLGDLQAHLVASGTDKAVTLSELTVRSPQGPLQVEAEGEFDFAERHFDTRLQWQSLAWPVKASTPQFKSPRGRLSATGLLRDYRFELDADAEGIDLPKGSWRLDGQGSTEALSAFSLIGHLLEGEVRAEGHATWQPEVRWRAKFNGRDINPGAHWSGLPGKLAIALSTEGSMTPTGPQLAVDLAELSGQLRGQALRGKGQLDMKGQALTVRGLQVAAGNARLDADGTLDDQLDLRWKLDAPDLGKLLPAAKGQIRGSGTFGGTRVTPRIDLNLTANDLRLGKTRIKRLHGDAALDASGERSSMLEFEGDGLQLAEQDFRRVRLAGDGTPALHQLRAELDGTPGRFELDLRGSVADGQWRGQLAALSARKTALGEWALEQPATVLAGKQTATVDRACLVSAPSRLCLEGGWSAQTGARGELALEQFTLQRLKDFLPEGLEVDSVLSGTASGMAHPGAAPRAEARFAVSPGRLLVSTDGKPVPIDIGGGGLEARMDNGNAEAQIKLDLGGAGRLDAVTRVTALNSTPNLDGTLRANLDDLGLISAFAPQLQAVSGRFTADLKVSGRPDAPALLGEVRLRDFTAEVPRVDVKVEDAQFAATSDGSGQLRLSGSARSGPGRLSIDGQLDPMTRALNLTVQGKEFQAAGSRTLQALLTPDLRIAMDGTGMRVEGELQVPKAYINAKGSGEGSAISVSPDVVIIEGTGDTEARPKAGNVNLNLRIVLGDDVKVEAGDFRGALKGNLVVEQSPQLAPRGTGTIEVVNGDYVVYGQQLNMQRGRILFSGGPIDNPRLDMDVARRGEAYDVLAGARIRGTAKAPLLQLYSKPSMPDAHILSYILLGQPPGTMGGTYTLGRYLTPDLYVSYGIGLFNAMNTFNLRYKLTDRLSLHAASGAASSADLIYTIER